MHILTLCNIEPLVMESSLYRVYCVLVLFLSQLPVEKTDGLVLVEVGKP